MVTPKTFLKYISILLLIVIGLSMIEDEKQPPIRSGEWITIYETDYVSDKVEPFEYDPDKIEEGRIYPDHPCTIARIQKGILITTTIDRQECFIPGYNTTLLTHWSDVATVTYNEDYIFPHPTLRMTARFMFQDTSGEEYYFHLNPEIFTDEARGNYNIFGQIRVSNKGNLIYVGEDDREITMNQQVIIEPNTWYDIVLEVDMKTRAYLDLKIGHRIGEGKIEQLIHRKNFGSKFTKREDNGMGDFRPFMGFWIGTNLPIEDPTTLGQDIYIDYFKVEVMK